MPSLITPRYNLVFTYDIERDREEAYYRFALSEFVPAMQGLGLYLLRAWYTAYGNYPGRQSEFVAEDLATIQEALDSEAFLKIEERLLDFVTNYNRRIFEFSDRFQM